MRQGAPTPHPRVDSRPGGGATFQMYLPEAEMTSPAAEPSLPAAAESRGTETILVAEDHGGVRSLIVGILRDRGYKVLEATTGDDAARLAERQPGSIDLLVSDIQMPRINGRDLAKRLRQLWPGMRVLFVSGYQESAPGEPILAAPGVSVMAKPFAPVELAAKVRELLDAPGAQVDLTRKDSPSGSGETPR